MNQGYFSQPTISATHIAFISDDDLWSVQREGGLAQRLTANKGSIISPCFSPDGERIAYVSTDVSAEGDIYIMPSQGGEAERLTWLGVTRIIGWRDNRSLYFANNMDAYPGRETAVYELDVQTREFKRVDLGPASYYYRGKGFQVLGRHSADSARWKRYRGGTAGVLWTQQGKEKFKRILKEIRTNIARPEVIGEQIFFISDHEGVANVYQCDLDGRRIKRLTHHLEYYCRNLRSHGRTLVYQAGAEIFTLDLEDGKETKININCATTAMQAIPRFETWARYFHGAALHPRAAELTVVSRGHLFRLPPFNGPVKVPDARQDIRYTHPDYNYKGNLLLVAGAHGESAEKLFLFDLEKDTHREVFSQINWGKIWAIKCSPTQDLAVVITNKKEVYLLDLKKNTFKKIEVNKFNRPAEPTWSPDGRYLAYTAHWDAGRSAIRIYDTQKSELRFLCEPVNNDFSPTFDPEGKYLYFIGVRTFSANYNETHFDLGFPFATRPYVVALNGQVTSPFETPMQNPAVSAANGEKEKNSSKKSALPVPVKVDIQYEGIENRILAFDMPLGGYARVAAIKGGLLCWRQPPSPEENHDRFAESPAPDLHVFRFEEGTSELYHKSVKAFYVNSGATHVVVHHDQKLRLLETKSKPTAESKIGKKDGYIDVTRIQLKLDPRQEWQQMYHEAWILQKEHFWRSDLSKIDWQIVYDRYRKVLNKVKTRAEFSDLMWEMQGELGTSHCYEMLGNYTRFGAGVGYARLGAFFDFNMGDKSYTIRRILRGDSWDPAAQVPLTGMGVSLKEGDRILAVDSMRFKKASDLYEFLENKGAMKVELTVQRKGSKKEENVVVKSVRQQKMAWYREWVNDNKKYVHEASKGRLGYVHIPDMGAYGYSEFYRNFINESQYDGVVVDVRYNGGGHVSQHLLKVLAQKILGFDETRHQGIIKYPAYAPGVLVAIANEQSGSDGDIFPHSFKLMKLGKLIGKRTWGGVIGINAQYSLRDGAYITQPEYSYWFKDKEWFVENHGVDPDIEVEITPEDYREGRDPQLDCAIREAMQELKKNPVTKFSPTYYPDLSLPKQLGVKAVVPTKLALKKTRRIGAKNKK